MSDLDSILRGEEVPKVEEIAEVAEVSEPESEPANTSEEPDAEAEESPKPKPETTSEEPEGKSEAWQYSAYKDEKSKRQEAVLENERLRAEISTFKSSNPEPGDVRDVFEDQEGFISDMNASIDGKLLQQKFNLTRDFMRDLKPDYAEMEDVFVGMLKDNPTLSDQVQQHANPAKFMYDQASKHNKFQEMQDVDAYEAKIEAKLRAKIEAEYSSNEQSKTDKTSNLTPSLATAKSSDSSQPNTVELGDLFKK